MHISKLITILLAAATLSFTASAQDFNGLDLNIGNLSRISKAQTRSISPENFTGEKGKGGMAVPDAKNPTRNVNNASWAARDLGETWKVNPYIKIGSGETVTIAEIEGPGAIQHIWMTPTGVWRYTIIRIYWDDEKTPSVECPIADFFCMGWNEYAPVVSLPVCVNPGSAFNCYWSMPFRKKCRITMENINDSDESKGIEDKKLIGLIFSLRFLDIKEIPKILCLNKSLNEKLDRKIYKNILTKYFNKLDSKTHLSIWKILLNFSDIKKKYDYNNILEEVNKSPESVKNIDIIK